MPNITALARSSYPSLRVPHQPQTEVIALGAIVNSSRSKAQQPHRLLHRPSFAKQQCGVVTRATTIWCAALALHTTRGAAACTAVLSELTTRTSMQRNATGERTCSLPVRSEQVRCAGRVARMLLDDTAFDG